MKKDELAGFENQLRIRRIQFMERMTMGFLEKTLGRVPSNREITKHGEIIFPQLKDIPSIWGHSFFMWKGLPVLRFWVERIGTQIEMKGEEVTIHTVPPEIQAYSLGKLREIDPPTS